mmetsp:Transcript_9973/g.13983  ORF Transcript_9973/g.13983 Transcript_9973/m.13983 type:complete len:408 (-) Transcript_9973:135-1358(-)
MKKNNSETKKLSLNLALFIFSSVCIGFLCGSQYTLFTLSHTLCDGNSFFVKQDFEVDGTSSKPTLRGKIQTSTTYSNLSHGKREWDNWPAVASEEVGHPLVFKGESFYDHARELYFTGDHPLMEEFLQVYKNRPDPVNMCGIRINHAMGLFLAVKQLKPTLVVESGVNAGVSTYFIRKASPTTRIFAVDPLDEPICKQGQRWIDPSHLTTYFTGSNFVDMTEMDWNGMIERQEFDPLTTLVFLDDHLHAYERIAAVMAHGIRHILVEDNYKQDEGATPKDKKSTPKQMFDGHFWKQKGDWLWERTKTYSEFPPLVPPIMAKENTLPRKKAGGFMVASDANTDIVHPILRPDLDASDNVHYKNAMSFLGLNPSLVDNDSYMQVMNYNQFCYLELMPEAAATADTFPKY